MKLRNLQDVELRPGQKVLLRVAYDVPLVPYRGGWRVASDGRLRQTLPTIQYLLKKRVSITLLSWLSRPGGKVVEKYRMDPVARALSKLIRRPVQKLDDCIGPKVFDRVQRAQPSEVLMLENVRFYLDEEQNGRRFAKLLAHGYDLLIFDAFAQAHRVHASTVGITRYLPHAVGLLVEREVAALTALQKKPKHPYVVVMGGAKLSDKIATLEALLSQADRVLIGGGMSNVFLRAQGVAIGKSFLEDAFVDGARRKRRNPVRIAAGLLKRFGDKIELPTDLVSASEMHRGALHQVVDFTKGDSIHKQWMFVDIGPKTAATYAKQVRAAKTVFWNGTLGVAEIPAFAQGTATVAGAIAKNRGLTVAGGGDTESAVAQLGLGDRFTHVSTGGGAALEFLSGKSLPALAALAKHK